MIKKDFLKSSVIYTVSSTLSTIASFILLPFYTDIRLLTLNDYGALALYIALSLLLQVVAGFSIDFYVGVAYHELKNDPAALRKKIAALNGYLIAIAALILTFTWLAGDFIIAHYIDNAKPESFRYLLMSVATGIFNAHFKFYGNLLIHREKPVRFFVANLFNFITTIAFTVLILVSYPQTLEGPLWGRFLSCFCIFLLSFTEITRAYGLVFSRKYLGPMLKFCLPLMVTAVFQWVLSSSDRYIIKPLLHNTEVAIFDLAVRFTLLVSFLLDGLSSAMSPRIFSLLNQNNEESIKEVNKYYSSFNLVTLVLVPLNILALPIILPLFVGSEKYLEAFLYFGIICAGFVTRSMQNLFIFPIHVYRKTSRLILINGIAAACQVGLGYLAVWQFKLYGAAFTLNIIKVIICVLYLLYCRDLLNGKVNMMKMIWLPLAVLLIISAGEMFIHGYGLRMHVIHLLEAFFVAGACLLFYRNELQDFMLWGLKMLKIKGQQ